MQLEPQVVVSGLMLEPPPPTLFPNLFQICPIFPPPTTPLIEIYYIFPRLEFVFTDPTPPVFLFGYDQC
jgi:hypothetical protein